MNTTITFRVIGPAEAARSSESIGCTRSEKTDFRTGHEVWLWEVEKQTSVADQISRVVEHLSRHEALLRQLVSNGCRLDLLVGLFIDGNEGFRIEAESLSAIGRLGVAIDLDLYAV